MRFLKMVFLPITAPIKFIQEHFKATLLVLIIFLIYNNSDTKPLEQPNLKQIDLIGPIIDANLILEEIEEVKNNPNIKGVLLNINSPGGMVAPSIEIAYAIKELNKIKPVVAYGSGSMASGSYYASIWASHIVANPGSIIGSIGVIFQSLDASELMEKIGIKTQNLKIGSYKEAGTPTRKWTKQEKEELKKVMLDTYNMFVKDVANARNLKMQDHKKFADAHIFTAAQAKEVGLIDTVAPINVAKRIVETSAKVKKPKWAKKDKIEKLMERLIAETVSKFSIYSNNLIAQ